MTMTPEARVAVESFRTEAMIDDKARTAAKGAAETHTVSSAMVESPAASSPATTSAAAPTSTPTAAAPTPPAAAFTDASTPSASATLTPAPASTPSGAGRAPRYIVTALGRRFRVSAEMAAIFLRQVERVVESDSSALVVLRHEEGVELLLVTDDNSFSIHALPE